MVYWWQHFEPCSNIQRMVQNAGTCSRHGGAVGKFAWISKPFYLRNIETWSRMAKSHFDAEYTMDYFNQYFDKHFEELYNEEILNSSKCSSKHCYITATAATAIMLHHQRRPPPFKPLDLRSRTSSEERMIDQLRKRSHIW